MACCKIDISILRGVHKCLLLIHAIVLLWNVYNIRISLNELVVMMVFFCSGEEKDTVKNLLTYKLRELMLHEDLEAVSVKQLKKKVEEEVAMDLSPYNAFLDQQMMVILKQMEKPSRIYDYLYLVRCNGPQVCQKSNFKLVNCVLYPQRCSVLTS